MEKKLKISGEDEQRLITAFKLGASVHEACIETGLDYEIIVSWMAIGDNAKQIERWQATPIWNAKKIFNQPKDHKEAETFLKRHPNTKTDYSDRTEHTGADGKDLIPSPILNGITQTDNIT